METENIKPEEVISEIEKSETIEDVNELFSYLPKNSEVQKAAEKRVTELTKAQNESEKDETEDVKESNESEEHSNDLSEGEEENGEEIFEKFKIDLENKETPILHGEFTQEEIDEDPDVFFDVKEHAKTEAKHRLERIKASFELDEFQSLKWKIELF